MSHTALAEASETVLTALLRSSLLLSWCLFFPPCLMRIKWHDNVSFVCLPFSTIWKPKKICGFISTIFFPKLPFLLGIYHLCPYFLSNCLRNRSRLLLCLKYVFLSFSNKSVTLSVSLCLLLALKARGLSMWVVADHSGSCDPAFLARSVMSSVHN